MLPTRWRGKQKAAIDLQVARTPITVMSLGLSTS